MKIKSTIVISLLLLAMLVVAGCTTTPGGPTATTTQQATTTQSAGPGQTTTQTGGTISGEPCSRDSVSGTALEGYLPSAQSGWQQTDSGSYSMDIPGEDCQYTWAWATFEQGDLMMDILIYDYNNWGGFAWGALFGYSYQDSSGYGKSVTVMGYPGFEMGDNSDQSITVMVDCGNGIWVWGMLDGSTDVGTIYAYMNSINYGGIAGLA